MKRYEDMTADQRREEYAAVRKAYEGTEGTGPEAEHGPW